jgi:polyhydroxyalkanoate synthesis regulator phasin
MGGERGGRVEHDEERSYSDWERRIDAMAVLLWGLKGTKKHFTVDEHRKAIESLPPAAYDAMAYYEKWIVALATCMVQRGVVTSDELAHKLQDVMFQRQHHDMGGRPAGKVEPTEHDYADWERRVDALAVLMGSSKLLTVDERRKAIESLPPQAYDAMSYYERWTSALAQTLVARGLITTEELARKMAEVDERSQV